jgi:hypothetical protein
MTIRCAFLELLVWQSCFCSVQVCSLGLPITRECRQRNATTCLRKSGEELPLTETVDLTNGNLHLQTSIPDTHQKTTAL